MSNNSPLWHLRATTSSAPASIRVRNLQTSVAGPSDAWGRPKRAQPALISAVVSLHDAFGVSTQTDSVASDTVHYGLLSKAILSSLSRPLRKRDEGSTRIPSEGDLHDVLHGIWCSLTGKGFYGENVRQDLIHEPFLSLQSISAVEIQIHLPKASLLGDGVSVIQIAQFAAPPAGRDNHDDDDDDGDAEMKTSCTCLRIHDVKVPTLIGVNDNERQAKQMVTANLEIEHVHPTDLDYHYQISTELVKTMSDSSFETLEALAKSISTAIAALLHSNFTAYPDSRGKPSWGLRITLEKPIAVVFADAACVELYVNTADIRDVDVYVDAV